MINPILIKNKFNKITYHIPLIIMNKVNSQVGISSTKTQSYKK